jgi:hypothetical protein
VYFLVAASDAWKSPFTRANEKPPRTTVVVRGGVRASSGESVDAVIKTVRVGFEPTVTRRPRQFSRLVRSTAPPPHLGDSGPFRPERHGTAVPRNSCSSGVASQDGGDDPESSADGRTWVERPATRPTTRGEWSFRAPYRPQYAGQDAKTQASQQRDDRWPPGGGGKTAGDHDAGECAEAAGRRRGALAIAE